MDTVNDSNSINRELFIESVERTTHWTPILFKFVNFLDANQKRNFKKHLYKNIAYELLSIKGSQHPASQRISNSLLILFFASTIYLVHNSISWFLFSLIGLFIISSFNFDSVFQKQWYQFLENEIGFSKNSETNYSNQIVENVAEFIINQSITEYNSSEFYKKLNGEKIERHAVRNIKSFFTESLLSVVSEDQQLILNKLQFTALFRTFNINFFMSYLLFQSRHFLFALTLSEIFIFEIFGVSYKLDANIIEIILLTLIVIYLYAVFHYLFFSHQVVQDILDLFIRLTINDNLTLLHIFLSRNSLLIPDLLIHIHIYQNTIR